MLKGQKSHTLQRNPVPGFFVYLPVIKAAVFPSVSVSSFSVSRTSHPFQFQQLSVAPIRSNAQQQQQRTRCPFHAPPQERGVEPSLFHAPTLEPGLEALRFGLRCRTQGWRALRCLLLPLTAILTRLRCTIRFTLRFSCPGQL